MGCVSNLVPSQQAVRSGIDTRSGGPLRRGDIVHLCSPSEILATLDESGSLDGLPFMPEMLGYFGQSYGVSARAERACDTISKTGARRMPNVVLLDDLRCDGSGHGGCQAACRIYWNEAWLSRGPYDGPAVERDDPAYETLRQLAVTNTHPMQDSTVLLELHRCQATEFLRASEPVGWWSVRSFFREVTCGNVSVWTFTKVMSRMVVEEIGRRLHLLSSAPFKRRGTKGSATAPHGLDIGERVRVRPADEIAETLDEGGKLRGLWFDREMLPYCGHETNVLAKVDRFIDERSGRMVELATDCFILDGVVCKGHLSEGRWFCPRAIYPWWREAWLEREDDHAEAGGQMANPSTS
jgi:hypothetical protein